jgi:hypothetical protein
MDDITLRERINRLSHEEELLYHDAGEGSLAPAEIARLHVIKLELDQSWDLLRQRQALRSAGMDPDAAKPRPIAVVEAYEQ